MKIGFVLDDGLDAPDGVQQYIITVASWLISQGHEVHYLVGETKRTDLANTHSLSKNIRVKFNRNRLSIPISGSNNQIKQILLNEKFDVLHVQLPFSPQLAGKIINLAHKYTRTAIVGTFHVMPFSMVQAVGSKILFKLTQKSLSHFNDVVAVSPAAQEFANSAMHLDCSVLPNAVALSSLSRGKPISKYSNTRNVVFLGRLVPRKGCLQLLAAVDLLIRSGKFEKSKLLICGDGPLRNKILRFIENNNMQNYVELVGQVSESEKADYLASANLAVLPSIGGESFGIVLVEAIAAGAQVTLGGDNPGYRFVLGQQNEALVNVQDTSLFAKRIDILLTDKSLANRVGESQRKRIKQFDIAVIGPKLLDIYYSAVAKVANSSDNGAHEQHN